MRTIHHPNLDQACRTAAAELTTWAASRLAEKSRLTIGVPGGRSVTPMLTALSAAGFPFDQCTLFLTDERMLPDGDPERNDGQITRTLVDIGIRVDGGHTRLEAPVVIAGDPEATAREYTTRFSKLSTAFDLMILGVGEDGHVASLFPDAPALASTERAYLPVYESPKPPAMRVSVSPALIREASLVVLLAFGDGKQDARSALATVTAPAAALPASIAVRAGASILITDLES